MPRLALYKKIGDGFYKTDELTDFFETIKNKCEFKYWFFGHYHDNAIIDDKFILLYDAIV